MRELAPCGTESAYQRHHRRGEPVDDACRGAHNDAAVAYRGRDRESKRDWVEKESVRRLIAQHRTEYQLLKAQVRAEEAARARREQRRRDERIHELLNGGQTT